jgi:hypothetical protein
MAASTPPESDPGCEYPRFWMGAEYLLWQLRGGATPPLVSFSPPGTPVTNAGVLGTRGAQTLFGGDRIDGAVRSGFRVEAGAWLWEGCLGVQGGYFYLGDVGKRFADGSPDGSRIVSRPFVDAIRGRPRNWSPSRASSRARSASTRRAAG